jgi:DNA-binding LacI/PurR family transcriptional regulator
MKKKIAVCGNGWNNEFLKVVLSGIRECATEHNVDIYVFMNYSYSEGVEYKDIGEANIFRLLDYADVDGVILLANTFHLPEEFDYLTSKIKSENIPAISLEYKLPEIDYMGSDNYSGMFDLCNHIFNVHEVSRIAFVSGPDDHEENIIRKKALEDAMEMRGLSLTPDRIICGEWNYVETVKRLPIWLDKQKECPQAFICANDVMAMATCAVLKDRHIRVPEDCIVTGFDHLGSARRHNPKITTVDRNWQDMGYQSLIQLLKKIEGAEIPNSVLIKSMGIPAKSCGCDYMEEKRDALHMDDNGMYDHLMNVVYWGGHLCDISESMVKVTKDEELHEWFNGFLVNEHQHEGDELYICLMDDFFSSIREGKTLRRRGFTDTVDVICGIKEGKSFPRIPKMELKRLVPGYETQSQESRFFLFLPIYDAECTPRQPRGGGQCVDDSPRLGILHLARRGGD